MVSRSVLTTKGLEIYDTILHLIYNYKLCSKIPVCITHIKSIVSHLIIMAASGFKVPKWRIISQKESVESFLFLTYNYFTPKFIHMKNKVSPQF